MELYFSNPPPVQRQAPKKKTVSSSVKELFTKYSKGNCNIDTEGIINFFEDLGISIEDPVAIVVCYLMDVEDLDSVPQEKFCKIFAETGSSCISELKGRIPDLLSDKKEFKKVYRYAHQLNTVEEARNVETETAIAVLQLLLPIRFPGNKFLDGLYSFMQSEMQDNGMKGVKKDVWNSILDYFEETGGDPNQWEDDGSWPIFIDKLVEGLRLRVLGNQDKK